MVVFKVSRIGAADGQFAQFFRTRQAAQCVCAIYADLEGHGTFCFAEVPADGVKDVIYTDYRDIPNWEAIEDKAVDARVYREYSPQVQKVVLYSHLLDGEVPFHLFNGRGVLPR